MFSSLLGAFSFLVAFLSFSLLSSLFSLSLSLSFFPSCSFLFRVVFFCVSFFAFRSGLGQRWRGKKKGGKREEEEKGNKERGEG